MKTTMTVKWAAALMLAATMAANAQAPGGRGPQGGGPGGPSGQFQPPSPDEIAKKIMADFDADKDGKLNADELKNSIAARQKQRQEQGGPQGGLGHMQQGGQGGQQPGGRMQGGPGGVRGGGPGGQQGGPEGERPQPPAPDQIAAKWLEEFDADKNGNLSSDELQKALASHRPPPPPMHGGMGGPRGGGPGGSGPGF